MTPSRPGTGALVLSAVLGLACASSGRGPTPSDDDYVGSDALVDRPTLKFVDDGERTAFDAARACFGERGRAWQTFPLRQIGNFVEQDWCTGPGAEHGCSGGDFRERAGAQWAGVGTLHYPQDWPEVFGVQVDAGRIVAEGWSVAASVSSGGRTVLGDGAHVSFRRGTEADSWVHLGSSYAHDVGEETVQVVAAGTPWEVFGRLRASPVSLRDEGVAQLRALHDEVTRKLDASEILVCVYGEYEGGGVPPPCLRRVPLTTQQVQTERQRLDAQTDRQIAALQSDAEAMHAALMSIVGPDCVVAP